MMPVRFRSLVTKPPQPHWFFNSSSAFCASARSRYNCASASGSAVSEVTSTEYSLAVAHCGHGRIEQRTIQVSEDLSDCPEWLDFPGVRRVFRILRETEYKKDGRQRRPEAAYFVTSLPEAGPKRLLDLVRGYWGAVEHGTHYVRDVALREDACHVRKGSLPRVLAAFANVAVSILWLLKTANIKREIKRLYRNGAEAVAKIIR